MKRRHPKWKRPKIWWKECTQVISYQTHSAKNVLVFFSDFSAGNSCAQENPEQSTEKVGVQYFCAYINRVVVSTFTFYPFILSFILLHHYLLQLPFYPCSINQDTDAVSAIVITCLFRQVGHRCRRHRQPRT